MEIGIGKWTWKINTLTYADDTTLLVEYKDDMIDLSKTAVTGWVVILTYKKLQ